VKSAIEIALERAAALSPENAKTLSAEQKAELAEIDVKFRAKWAEREIFLQRKLAELQQAGKWQEVEQVEEELRREKLSLEQQKEQAKDRVRHRPE
jgi:hypothetical protein